MRVQIWLSHRFCRKPVPTFLRDALGGGSDMIARNMRIDFTDAPLLWSKDKNWATMTNAGSPGATAFEPYLNQVMAWARLALDGTRPELERDIDLFIARESHHLRVHKQF